MSYQFEFDEEEEMMVTQHIYLSSDESESSTPCSSPDHQLPNNVPDLSDAITQLIASQYEEKFASGTTNVQYPPTTTTSLISDDDEDELFAPIAGNPSRIHPIYRTTILIPYI